MSQSLCTAPWMYSGGLAVQLYYQAVCAHCMWAVLHCDGSGSNHFPLLTVPSPTCPAVPCRQGYNEEWVEHDFPLDELTALDAALSRLQEFGQTQ